MHLWCDRYLTGAIRTNLSFSSQACQVVYEIKGNNRTVLNLESGQFQSLMETFPIDGILHMHICGGCALAEWQVGLYFMTPLVSSAYMCILIDALIMLLMSAMTHVSTTICYLHLMSHALV